MGRDRDSNVLAGNCSTSLTRRGLFELAGLATAAAVLPARAGLGARPASPAAATGQPVSPVTEKLSTYMSEARSRALPDEVVEKTKQHILDTLAAMVSGCNLAPGRDAIRFVTAYGGKEVATVIGSSVVCGPIEAALTNAMLSHADETDDAHSPSHSHPGCAVVPAALAAGEQFGIDGMHFLRAVTLGYDIGPRVTMALGAAALMNQHHKSSPSVAAIFGAAATAGCAANLTAQQMRWMLDYTAQQCSGLAAWRRDTQHVEKAFAFGAMGARSGITSALVVHSGWTGIDDIFSGPDNFFMAFVPHADPTGLIEKLGERYEVTLTDIKKWPVGSPIQAAVDAMEILRKRHPFEADQVQRVIVRLGTNSAVTVNNRQMPDISLQYIMAVMLIDKTVSLHAANDKARMKDPAVLRQQAKVTLIPDQELERLMPRRVAIIEVTLANGTQLTQRVDNVRGTPQNPMTREEIEAKARDRMTPVLGAMKTSTLIEKVFGIESVKDIRELRPLLQPA